MRIESMDIETSQPASQPANHLSVRPPTSMRLNPSVAGSCLFLTTIWNFAFAKREGVIVSSCSRSLSLLINFFSEETYNRLPWPSQSQIPTHRQLVIVSSGSSRSSHFNSIPFLSANSQRVLGRSTRHPNYFFPPLSTYYLCDSFPWPIIRSLKPANTCCDYE